MDLEKHINPMRLFESLLLMELEKEVANGEPYWINDKPEETIEKLLNEAIVKILEANENGVLSIRAIVQSALALMKIQNIEYRAYEKGRVVFNPGAIEAQN